MGAEQPSRNLGEWNGDRAALFARRDDGAGVRRISVEFDRGPTSASAARNALMALEDQLAPGLLDDIRLLVSELVTNSIRHAEGDSSGSVGLQVDVKGHQVRVDVTDTGEGFEPAPRTADQSKASGWGLYLVDRLADRWGVMCNNLTHVWFEIDSQSSLAPQQAV